MSKGEEANQKHRVKNQMGGKPRRLKTTSLQWGKKKLHFVQQKERPGSKEREKEPGSGTNVGLGW